jgi:hypothetical protein
MARERIGRFLRSRSMIPYPIFQADPRPRAPRQISAYSDYRQVHPAYLSVLLIFTTGSAGRGHPP